MTPSRTKKVSAHLSLKHRSPLQKSEFTIRSKLFDPQNIARLEDSQRSRWQKPEEVVKALELENGEVVADIGAGSGYFTFHLAEAVAPDGKVFAIDVQEEVLSHLRRKLTALEKNSSSKKSGGSLRIVPVRSSFSSLRLEPSSIDLAFMCAVYHETGGKNLLEAIMRVLKPSGRLAIIDWRRRLTPVGPPQQDRIRKRDFVREVTDNGFGPSASFEFLPYQYFFVFRKRGK